MSISIVGQQTTSGLVFVFDAFNQKSYRGEPTTNLNKARSDYTGTSYSTDGEWTTDPTRFTKVFYPNLDTPIGLGATYCCESGTAGFHHLSRYGGGEESGTHTISCYISPLSNNITNFTIGMLNDSNNTITFNFTNDTITYGGSISNRNSIMQKVAGWPGWYRIGANIEGRGGGWVGCLGLNVNTSYTPSAPYKSFYITGIQYEYKDHITQYVSGSRSVTDGLINLVGGSSVDMTNGVYNTSASFVFNGSSAYFTTPAINLSNTFTITAWVKSSNVSGDMVIVGEEANGCDNWFSITSGYVYSYFTEIADVNNAAISGGTLLSNNVWYHVAVTINQNTARLYLNGRQDATSTVAFTIGSWNGTKSIGRRCPSLAQRYFNGSIDSVYMYNRVLTREEILKNYNATKGRYGQ